MYTVTKEMVDQAYIEFFLVIDVKHDDLEIVASYTKWKSLVLRYEEINEVKWDMQDIIYIARQRRKRKT
jgi:hypothetical protein